MNTNNTNCHQTLLPALNCT